MLIPPIPDIEDFVALAVELGLDIPDMVEVALVIAEVIGIFMIDKFSSSDFAFLPYTSLKVRRPDLELIFLLSVGELMMVRLGR